jgi:phosphoglycolate phosphatase
LPTLIIKDTEVEAGLVLFDFDGTLVDGGIRHRNLASARTETIGRLAGPEAVGNWASLSGVDIDTGGVDPNGPLAGASRREDLAVASAAIYLTGRTWNQARELAMRAYEDADVLQESIYRPVLFPGVEGTLRSLREAGYRLGIATNGEGSSVEAMAQVLGVDHLFDVILGAGDVKEAKPAPDMILLACERTGVAPDETIFVGDMLDDMQAGKAAGVRAVIAVNNQDEQVRGMADFALESITGIRIN